MPFLPTYGSVFVYGAAESPDKLRLSGPAPSSPAAGAAWYGDTPATGLKGEPIGGGNFGPAVDQWYNVTHPGYPAGPPIPGQPLWVPNPSWLYGVNLPDGTYTRIKKTHWETVVSKSP